MLYSSNKTQKPNDSYLDYTKRYACLEYLQATLPNCCLVLCRLRPKGRAEKFKKARDKLADEMDLVSLLQNVRFFNAAMKQLLTPEKFEQLKTQTMKLSIDTAKYEDSSLI